MLKKAQRKRLQRLFADEDLTQIAAEVYGYYRALRDAGFKRDEAFELTHDLHDALLGNLFEVPPWMMGE